MCIYNVIIFITVAVNLTFCLVPFVFFTFRVYDGSSAAMTKWFRTVQF